MLKLGIGFALYLLHRSKLVGNSLYITPTLPKMLTLAVSHWRTQHSGHVPQMTFLLCKKKKMLLRLVNYCVFVFVFGCVHQGHTWWAADNLLGLVLSFCGVGPGHGPWAWRKHHFPQHSIKVCHRLATCPEPLWPTCF